MKLFLYFIGSSCLEPKYCVNCKHFKTSFPKEFGKCTMFPKIQKDENFLVTGNKKTKEVDYEFCSVVRMYEDRCGYEGKLYKNRL